MSEPRKHHYIPQFILRNFATEDTCDFDKDKQKIYYYDLKTKVLNKEFIKDVFMKINLYRDETKKESPVIIENNLSVFECEIAPIIKKFKNDKEIILNRNEFEKLRIFLGLQAFRALYRNKSYVEEGMDKNTIEKLKEFSKDKTLEQLWKDELNELANCRKVEEIKTNDKIDPILKQEFTEYLQQFYFTVVESRGADFLISDVYPTLEMISLPKLTIIYHILFPISSNRIILMNNIMFKKQNLNLHKDIIKRSKIQGNAIKEPISKHNHLGCYSYDDTFTYKVTNIYENDVNYINELCLNEARECIAFSNKDRIIDSLYYYENEEGILKNNFDNLIKQIEE